MRVPKVPLGKTLVVDDFTSVNRVLLLLLFCTGHGEAVLNLVRGSLNDNTLFNEQENVHFVCIFKSDQTYCLD